MKHIEENIKRIAKEKGHTMTDVIRAVDMSQAGFYRSFDKSTVKVSTLIRISEFLKVPLSQIFFNLSFSEWPLDNSYKFDNFLAGAGTINVLNELKELVEKTSDKEKILEQINYYLKVYQGWANMAARNFDSEI